MLKKFEACLVLGCNGHIVDEEFCNCRSVDNKILSLPDLPDDKYDKVYHFLDHACDLFSGPMNDYNKVVNTLSFLYKNYEAYNKDKLVRIQLFIKTHKGCGLWLSLFMLEDYDGEKELQE